MLNRTTKLLGMLAISFISKNSFAQNIGIGIPAPDEKLHVDSVIRIGKNAIISPGSVRKNFLKFGDGDFTYIAERDKDDRMVLRAGSFSFKNGDVAINADSATAALDVNGPLRFRNTSGTAGNVLTSDAQGYATWKTPAPVNTSFLACADALNVPTGVNTKVPFTTEHGFSTGNIGYDDFNSFNSTAYNFTTPVAGAYHYDVTVRFAGGTIPAANGSISIRLAINGALAGDLVLNTNRSINFLAGQPMPLYISTSGVLPLNASTVVEVYIFQNSGVAIDLFNGPNCNFSMFRVR